MRRLVIDLLIGVVIILGTFTTRSLLHLCERQTVISPMGIFTYWRYRHGSHGTSGICANVYQRDDEGWEVEIPAAGSPTALYQFDAAAAATNWAEKNCPTELF